MKTTSNKSDELKSILSEFSDFILRNGRTPIYRDYKTDKLKHSRQYYERVSVDNNTLLEDVVYRAYLDLYGQQINHDYQHYVAVYQTLMNNYDCTFYNAFNFYKETELLPDTLWMIKNSPIPSVINGMDWVHHYCLSSTWTKRMVIDAVSKASNLAGRNVKYEDFQNRSFGLPPVTAMLKHWKSINAMNDELGIKRNRDCMSDRSISSDEAIIDFLRVCSEICENRKDQTLTTREINFYPNSYSCDYYRKAILRKHKMSLMDFAKQHGYNLGNPGNGNVYTFEDGEVTESQYERIFSEFLRSRGLHYGIDYLRSVYYADIICSDVGYKKCDYIINYNGRKIVIEIAGMLSSYKRYYVNNIPILASKSKEHYRQSLKYKEQLLLSSGVQYFILFPCDLSINLLNTVLDSDYNSVKTSLASFNKNNIDWTAVIPTVGVLYDWNKIGKDNQPACLCSR